MAEQSSPWRVVCCPGEVRFASIAKERQTLARIYALYRDDQTLWLGQSISRLMPFLREHLKLRVHLSSAYRIIRGECKRGLHNGFAVKRLEDAREVNELLDSVRPKWLAVVLRDPDKWTLATEMPYYESKATQC
jgi:hypothetical protein